jgi:hypothetical protein
MLKKCALYSIKYGIFKFVKAKFSVIQTNEDTSFGRFHFYLYIWIKFQTSNINTIFKGMLLLADTHPTAWLEEPSNMETPTEQFFHFY